VREHAGHDLAMAGANLDTVTLILALAGEVFLGFIIGFIMMLPIAAVQMGALIMGQQMGFGLASVYNPAIESDSDLLGELLIYIALGAYIVMGGVEASILAVLRTVDGVPLGTVPLNIAPLELIVGMLGAGLELALRISAPLLAIVFFETIASGFIMRTIPQINVMSIGFAVKIILGLIAVIGGLVATDIVVGEHIGHVARAVVNWSASL
jgi:flagellar biosynthetic protein FliR